MSKFKYSLLAASVTLCFASHAGATEPTYQLGTVTIDGAAQEFNDLTQGFSINGADVVIKADGTFTNNNGQSIGNRAIWLTTNQTGNIKAQNLTVESALGRAIQASGGADINIEATGDTVVNVNFR